MKPLHHTRPPAAPARRIGLFGGTFDPIHLGHMEVADAARRRFELDEICLVPSAQPPHKRPIPAAAPADRLAMVRLAAAGRAGFSVSAVELEREGPSYTIETITQVKNGGAPNAALFFLIGYDAFLELNTWKAYNAILQQVDLIVLARARFCSQDLDSAITALKRYIHRHLDPGYRWDGQRFGFVHPELRTIYFFDGPRLNISATEIRRRLGQGLPVGTLVPAAVAGYIEQKGLYR